MLETLFNFVGSLIYYTGYAALILGLIVLGGLFLFQNKLLYMPVIPNMPKSPSQNPASYRNPKSISVDYEDVEITTQDNIKIRGWYMKIDRGQPAQRTVVFFHQNAGNIGPRIYYLRQYMYRTRSNILIVAYRGYSDSESEPSEHGLKLDSLAIAQYVSKHPTLKQMPVYFHGRSLGGAVASYAVTHSPFKPKAIILEVTFTSIDDMVEVLFGPLKYFRWLVLRNFWRTVELIPKIDVPIMFIKAGLDQLVPIAHMNTLATVAKKHDKKVKQYTVEEGTHNQVWNIDPVEYFRQVSDFFDECEAKAS